MYNDNAQGEFCGSSLMLQHQQPQVFCPITLSAINLVLWKNKRKEKKK